jgi:hypothetical protein
MEDMIGNTIERLLADAGYRGHNAPTDYKFRVYTSGQKRWLTPQIKRELRRRAAIEPVIGHLKAEHTAWAAIILHTVPAMPLTPCCPPPVITSISCLDGWSSCCLDSWRLRKPRPPFNGSENRKTSRTTKKRRCVRSTSDGSRTAVSATNGISRPILHFGALAQGEVA